MSGQFPSIGPFQPFFQGVGVGDGAVAVGNTLHQFFRTVRHQHRSAAFVLIPFGKARKQVRNQGSSIRGFAQGRVQGIRLRAKAHRNGIAAAIDGCLVEQFAPHGSAETAFHGIVHQIQVAVKIQRHDGTGGHQQILRKMHQLITGVPVRTGPDGGDQHIVGLRPGALFNLNVIAVPGQVQVVNGIRSVVTLAEAGGVVPGTSGPHFQKGDGVIVIDQPAAVWDKVMATVRGIQKSIPVQFLQLELDSHRGEYGLKKFSHSPGAFPRTIQVSQGREIGEHPVFIHIVIPGQDGICFCVVVLVAFFGSIVVTGVVLAVAGVSGKRGTISIGHVHRHK